MIASATAVSAAALALTVGALTWAAISDLRFYLIPNRIPAAVTVAYFALAAFLPWTFVVNGFLTGLAVLSIGTLVFARGWMGGGDVKLLAAVSLWAGTAYLSVFALVTCLSSAVLAALLLSPARRFLPAPSLEALNLTGADGVPARQPMPFGVPIALGGIVVVGFYLPLVR